MKRGGWLWLLLVACVARLWLMLLPSSFWLDEMATVFVVRHGPADPSLAAAAPQAWRSVYYWLPRASQALLGSSEFAYRLPSVLAMAVALWLIAKLAARLIHPQAAWFAVFACMALRGLNYEAADARPYALGICVAAASLLFLVRWMDSGKWVDALLFVVFAALLWRVHLMFWPMYVVFALYALRRPTWRTAAVFGVLALVLVPVALDAVTLYHEARAHVFAPPPTFRQLWAALRWPVIVLCAAAAVRSASLRSRLGTSAVVIGGWWLCQPLCLFAVSRLTGNNIFVPRYFAIALPGAALAATLAISVWIPERAWKPLAATLGIAVLGFMGQWRELWPRHHNSDWRGAAREVNEIAGPDMPVLCPSPFVEAVPPVWRPDYPLSGFLYAHLAVYPIRGKIYELPFADSPQAEQFIAQAPLAGRFVIYGWEPQVHFWMDWFSARREMAGWKVRRFGPFADVAVVEFARVNIIESWRKEFGNHYVVARTGKEPVAGRRGPL